MSAPSFTPGPWDWWDDGQRLVRITEAAEQRLVAQVILPSNARLIDAAPELYEAAVKHLEWIEKEHAGPDYGGLTRDTHPDGERIWRNWWGEQLDLCADTERLCRVAIAKARGDCPGHVARDDNPKVCRHCGTHVDSERPAEDVEP